MPICISWPRNCEVILNICMKLFVTQQVYELNLGENGVSAPKIYFDLCRPTHTFNSKIFVK